MFDHLSLWFDDLSLWWWRKRFGFQHRGDFYRMLSMQLRSNVQIQSACEAVAANHAPSDEESSFFASLIRPVLNTLFPNTVYTVASECAAGISAGRSFHDSLAPWIPYDELATIRAGARAGATAQQDHGVASALDRADAIVTQKEAMKREIAEALSEPVGNLLLAVGSLYAMVTMILPKLLVSASRPGQVHVPTFSETCARFLADYGLFIGAGIGLAIALVLISFPRLTGELRIRLDRIPPWSIYRQLQGAVVFYNLGSLMASGVKKLDALEMLSENATPYMRERIDGMRLGAATGKTIGGALHLSGYEFPSKEAIGYIRIVSKSKGGEENLRQLGVTWLEESLRRVKRSVKKVRTLSFVLVALNVFLVASLINDMGNSVMDVMGKM